MSVPSVKLIAASAGSGKTFQLTKRYIELLFNGNDISSILAVTFTDNAAKEMKTRILHLLKNCAIGSEQASNFFKDYRSLSQKSQDILDNIFERYNQFNIRTIDSFITSIFLLSSFELGHIPDVNLRFNYKASVDDFIFSFLCELISLKKNKLIDDFINFINETENSFIFDPTSKLSEIFSLFFKKEDDYLAQLTNNHQQEGKKLSKLIHTGRDIIKKLKALSKKYKESFYSSFIKALELNNPYEAAKEALDKGRVIKDKIPILRQEEQIINLSKDYLVLRAEIFYTPYLNIFLYFKEFFRNSSRKTKTFILSSMAGEIKRMIDDDRQLSIQTIMMRLSTVFRHFMIDEFQDTSHAQWLILKPFIEEALSCGGSCFLIGDIKQAIYMFRNADYRIMKDMIENPKNTIYLDTSTLENGIEISTTTVNYRSSSAILDYVNRFFGSQEFAKYLESNGFERFKEIYSIQHIHKTDDEGYVESVVVNDDLKSRFISIINDVASRFPLSSIAVLSYRNDKLKEIAAWLSDEEINCVSYSELDIRENSVIVGVINLLRFINNQSDEISFSKFILSPVFRGIFRSRSEIEDMMITANLQRESKVESFKKSFPKVWENYFEDIIEESRKSDVYSLVKFIISLYAITQHFPDDNGYILKLMDLTSMVVREEGIYSLSDFIDFIDNASEDDERFYIDISSTINAVKLMTFHKAKGLEFDVVINIFDQTKKSGAMIFYDIDGQKINLYSLNQSVIKANKRLEGIYLSNIMDEKISEINTVYVALTRAKKELYNIVMNLRRKPDIFDLFKNYTAGKKTTLKKIEEKTSDFVFKITQPKKKITYNLIPNLSTAQDEGRIYHRAISLILMGCADSYFAVRKAFILEQIPFKKEIARNVEELIKETLSDKNLLLLIKGNRIRSEVEFANEDGNVFRSDLIVENEKGINVVDLKTGQPNISDISQMEDYIKALRHIYPKTAIKGYLYYVREKKIVEVKTME
ncbi:MAG: UvrD-helicase domain-containing protein [Elusimicrobiales bacterium]